MAPISTMRQVRIERVDLLEALKQNLTGHRHIFLEAQEGYRKMMMEELTRMLEEAAAGKQIRRQVTIPEPTDHSEDYESVILMLEMCVDKVIEITVEDFQQFVMDNWGWKRKWTDVTSSYTN